jgi:hypothetical protein
MITITFRYAIFRRSWPFIFERCRRFQLIIIAADIAREFSFISLLSRADISFSLISQLSLIFSRHYAGFLGHAITIRLRLSLRRLSH